MSYPDPTNPYASPTAVSAGIRRPTCKPIDSIEYMRTYQLHLREPELADECLWSFLCQLVGKSFRCFGQHGAYSVISLRSLDGLLAIAGRGIPISTSIGLATILVRGVWPFLVQLVAIARGTPVSDCLCLGCALMRVAALAAPVEMTPVQCSRIFGIIRRSCLACC